ncbi:MAG: hypothetical protein HZC40_10370 [Chloroflexi bacterium]|nr:hypothetical protein [Chloroflexota bacterium]
MKRAFRKFIGNYLLEDNVLTLADLDRALARQLELGFRDQPMKIGDVLIEMGVITRVQLERALERQARESGD